MLFYLWHCGGSPPPLGRTVISEKGVKLFVESSELCAQGSGIVQGISLPLLHTLLPPHHQPSTAGSLSSRALLEGECATAAHHKHFISIPCSLVVHPAANDFLPHCAGSFLLQGSRKLECTAEVQTSRDAALPAGFYPWP